MLTISEPLAVPGPFEGRRNFPDGGWPPRTAPPRRARLSPMIMTSPIALGGLAEFLADARRRVEAALDRYLPPEDAPADLACPPRLARAMRYSVMAGGKRLRPALALMAAEACGAHPDVALPAACALEMIHTYSLVHDDLPAMDDDDLRRGIPTCHKAFDEATA